MNRYKEFQFILMISILAIAATLSPSNGFDSNLPLCSMELLLRALVIILFGVGLAILLKLQSEKNGASDSSIQSKNESQKNKH